MPQTKKKSDQFTADFMDGLSEINKLGKGATIIDVACALIKHLSPHIKSVKFEDSRKISVSNSRVQLRSEAK